LLFLFPLPTIGHIALRAAEHRIREVEFFVNEKESCKEPEALLAELSVLKKANAKAAKEHEAAAQQLEDLQETGTQIK
jgi:glycyl-tRNA synthetase (class II)